VGTPKDTNATEERFFLCDPCRDVLSRTSEESKSLLVGELDNYLVQLL
jgi:hypothetical protein